MTNSDRASARESVWIVRGFNHGCCAPDYCGEYDEGVPVVSIHATKEEAEKAALGREVSECMLGDMV